MAIMARWRMPPENSCGYCVGPLVGACGMPTSSSSSTARALAAVLADVVVGEDHLGDLAADAVHRVQRRQRVLEDHGDALTPDAPDRLLGPADQLLALQLDATPTTCALGGQQAHRGQHRHGLARARLPDDAEDLPRSHLEGDAPDRLDRPVVGGEVDVEVADLEDGGRSLRLDVSWRGSRASRRPSPRKLTHRIVMSSVMPGNSTIQPLVRRDRRLRVRQQVAPGRARSR